MIRKALFTTALFAVLALPARAGEGGEKKETAPMVQLQSLAIPITVNGRLANYLFLSIRINLTDKAPEAKVREKEPYFRDAVVRVSSKISFNKDGRDDQLDQARFKAALLPEFARIAGPNVVKSIDVLKESPKRRTTPAPPVMQGFGQSSSAEPAA